MEDFNLVEVPKVNYFLATGNIINDIEYENKDNMTIWRKKNDGTCIAKMNYNKKGSSFWLDKKIANTLAFSY